MYDNINELVDINLNRFLESGDQSLWLHDFVGLDKKERLYDSVRLAEYMRSKGLLTIDNERCDLTEFGFKVVQNGGWIKVRMSIEEQEESERLKEQERQDLELNLAKSNLEANKLNKKIAKQNEKHEKFNKTSTVINIILGALNVGLLVWQILKG